MIIPGIDCLRIRSRFLDSSRAVYNLVNKESYLSFFLIEVIVTAREALHGDKEVSEGGLELGPLVTGIEKLPHESLDLYLVKIREQSFDAVDQEADHEVLVCWEAVRCSVLLIYRALDDNAAGFDGLEHLLKDQALKLEAANVPVVGHYCEDVTND